jgi:hypothetical protein
MTKEMRKKGSISKLDPNRYEALKQALYAAMIGRSSAHARRKPQPVRRNAADYLTAAKKKALNFEQSVQGSVQP